MLEVTWTMLTAVCAMMDGPNKLLAHTMLQVQLAVVTEKPRNGECCIWNEKNNASQPSNAKKSIKHREMPELHMGNEKKNC